jgi:bifunctional DNA primase/polymerase-like protein/primase-like protein
LRSYQICKIPVRVRSKVPLLVKWQTYTADDPILARTFIEHPGCNVGIRLDGLLVADCDSPERVAWWEKEAPYTPFQSRGDPTHLSFWYRAVDGVFPMRLPALDIKTGPGHFMAVPPSIHPKGWPYRWMGPEVAGASFGDIPLAPVDFLADLRQERTIVLGNTDASVILEHEGRDNLLAAVGGTLRRRGFGYDLIFAFLMGGNQAVCEPPLSVTDVSRIAHSVCRYQPKNFEFDTVSVIERTVRDFSL